MKRICFETFAMKFKCFETLAMKLICDETFTMIFKCFETLAMKLMCDETFATNRSFAEFNCIKIVKRLVNLVKKHVESLIEI